MKDFILQNFDVVCYVALGLFSSLSGLSIFSLIRSKVKTRMIEKELDLIKERQTYIICPHCKKKVAFSELEFHLPDGGKDQNLNGIPDEREK